MMRVLVRLRGSRRGVAALEFALTAPFLLILLGGLTDFGFALWDKAKLADAVAIGAQYAYLNAATVTEAQVKSLVITTSGLGSTVSVTAPKSAPSCINGTSLSAGTNPCADGNAPGTYMTITASYAYPAILPAYSMLVGATLTESATVRIQ